MYTLHIEKINETFLKIHTEPSIQMELFDHFAFLTPGHKFDKRFKERRWDGKIRLFSLKTKQIRFGLLPFIKEFCDERNYEYILDFKETTTNIDMDRIESLSLYSKDTKLSITTPERLYQWKSIKHCLENKRVTLVSPVNSGKSLMIYCIVRYLMDEYENKVLVIVPTVDLVEQFVSDFEDYSNKDIEWDAQEHVQKIYSGHSKDLTKKIAVSTWQSLQHLDPEVFEDVDVVICDEAHKAKASEIVGIIESCINAEYKLGFTGTLQNEKCHELVIQGLFGKSQQYTTVKEMQENNTASELEINCFVLKYSPEERRLIGKPRKKSETPQKRYVEELKFLIEHQDRNEFIGKLTSKLQGNSLVLFDRIEHGERIYDTIKKANPNKKIFLVTGQIKGTVREEIRNFVENNDDCIIVAVTKIFSTGINIRSLANIVFTHPNKARIPLIQGIGRILRKSSKKTKARVFDIVDDLCYNNRKNYAVVHFIERVKVYNSEKYDYNIHEVKTEKWQKKMKN